MRACYNPPRSCGRGTACATAASFFRPRRAADCPDAAEYGQPPSRASAHRASSKRRIGDYPPENACGLSASPRHIRALRRCPASVPERCIHNSFAPFKLAPGIGKYFAIFHFEYHIRLTDYFAIVGHHENRFFTSEGLHERQHFIP